MSSTFFGLQIASSALHASRTALEVIGHNVANASNPAYSRQRVELVTKPAFPHPSANSSVGAFQLGSGVEARSILRMVDNFVVDLLRTQRNNLSDASISGNILRQVEGVFSEPGESGLGAQIGLFWNSWEELSMNPEDIVSRRSLIQQSNMMIRAVANTGKQLENIQQNLDFDINNTVNLINTLSSRIAGLNIKIGEISANGNNPNDLMDERDELINQLSEQINVRIWNDSNDMLTVFVGNKAIVRRGDAVDLESYTAGAHGFHYIRWSDDSSPISIQSGRVNAMIDMRDIYIEDAKDDLNSIVSSIINEVNSVHSTGLDLNGNPVIGTAFENFFVGSDFNDIAVNPALEADLNGIAASAGGGPGDGENARAIAAIKEQNIIGGSSTVNDFYRSLVSRIGIDAKAMRDEYENVETMLYEIGRWRDSVSGVNLDEEMVSMIQFQHAYQAASRLVRTMDEMLATLLNEIGTAGRR